LFFIFSINKYYIWLWIKSDLVFKYNKNLFLIETSKQFIIFCFCEAYFVSKSIHTPIANILYLIKISLFYYNVNSLYPYAALNDMPGTKCKFEDNIDQNIKELNNIFGFFYVKVTAPNNNYLGLLPYRINDSIIKI